MNEPDVLDVADRLWRGELAIESHHPMAPRGGVTEVAAGCAFVPSFANVSALATDVGLVLVDTGSELTWIPRPVLQELGIAAERRYRFVVADGRVPDETLDMQSCTSKASRRRTMWCSPSRRIWCSSARARSKG